MNCEAALAEQLWKRLEREGELFRWLIQLTTFDNSAGHLRQVSSCLK